ncbi:uncharacterized protein Tco025E_02639 [Trypanosoma conorhini]|uniref:Uncharacterized protein n=1 Tax=Trypanosoma conorhini TaxID=83891 RepID=A0A3R7NMS8_9TRYP|nr:uncharacterized protein Tco025E_02639 [Trypanosoma conorhini]RNF24280.1 hypothetical protein Tco025E_02639 [Trypanosoma conorhini]
MQAAARFYAAGGGGRQGAGCSPSPVLASPPLRDLRLLTQEWPSVDAASPPLREKTEKPTTVGHLSVEANFAAGAEPPRTLYSNCSNRCGGPSTTIAAASSARGGSTSNPASCGLRESDPNIRKMEVVCGATMDRAAERDWARSLQRCLLETETKAQKFCATAKLHEQEALAAAEEVVRLREATSLQAKRIEELEQRLAQAQLAAAGPGEDCVADQSGVLTASVESLEGLCIDDIKRVVHCAAEALRRIEAEFEAERRRRCTLEKENNSLRRQLHFACQVGGTIPDGGMTHWSGERQNCAMTSVQGPLQRFIAGSAELQARLGTSLTCHTSAPS